MESEVLYWTQEYHQQSCSVLEPLYENYQKNPVDK